MEATYYLYIIKTRCMQFYNYAYLGVDKASKNAFVVDPSWDISQILEILDKHEAKLEKVLLTHSHFDHTNMVTRLVRKFNLDVYMSEEEIEYYEYNCINLNCIHDLEVINVGETKIKCLVTPGHTKGSTCYWSGDNLFTGDTIFMEGCGICDIPGGSAEEMYHSINRLKKIIPLDICVYTGHSFGEEPGKDMRYLNKKNIYFQIDNINHFVKYRNRKDNKGIFNFK
ncbi:MBL fold metallo-hydrolase [Clostridium estertheticum]|uniref:MBL fold metallo-hydrolase n=1 Tax=Clostridium estertheticum TaxID=238834 RepID=UPI0013EEB7E8|nr:MBL fold metallo-hydrolase [Clostridium estertheticum]MBZ9609081.1 MBL fold metallo-hydrolase [Clostridium estertheticum]